MAVVLIVGPRTSNNSTIGELVRNLCKRTDPKSEPLNQQLWGGPAICVLRNPPGDSDLC